MTWLWVFLGGGLGAMGRYGLGLILPRLGGGFPWATFSANVIGAFLIGLIAGMVLGREGARAFWIVGLLGGFTTFSAFSYETLQLMHQREALLAFTYVAGSLGAGLGACWLGMRIWGYA